MTEEQIDSKLERYTKALKRYIRGMRARKNLKRQFVMKEVKEKLEKEIEELLKAKLIFKSKGNTL